MYHSSDPLARRLIAQAKNAAQRLLIDEIQHVLRDSAQIGRRATIRNVIRCEVSRLIHMLQPSTLPLDVDPELAKANAILSLL